MDFCNFDEIWKWEESNSNFNFDEKKTKLIMILADNTSKSMMVSFGKPSIMAPFNAGLWFRKKYREPVNPGSSGGRSMGCFLHTGCHNVGCKMRSAFYMGYTQMGYITFGYQNSQKVCGSIFLWYLLFMVEKLRILNM